MLAWRLDIEGKRALYNQFTDYQNAVIDASRQPYDPHARITNVPLDPVTAFYYPLFGVDPYSANQFFRVKRIDSQTQNELLIVTLALRQYWLKYHAYPATLSELTPKYLSAIPADPFAASTPLHYARSNNAYSLYSVGPDGKDNHGTAIAIGAGDYLQDSSEGDIVAGVNP